VPAKTLTDQKRQARRETDRQRTREAVEPQRASEGWQQWLRLRLRHHFHDHSRTNQLMIATAMPEATRARASMPGSSSATASAAASTPSSGSGCTIPPTKKQLTAGQQSASRTPSPTHPRPSDERAASAAPARPRAHLRVALADVHPRLPRRQGEPGDFFYVVRAGRAEVLQDGRLVRELGAGECFGEIALLRDQPRSATVRSAEGPRLEVSRLRRTAFLTAVTGYPAAAVSAQELVARRLEADAGRLRRTATPSAREDGAAPAPAPAPEAEHVGHPAPRDVDGSPEPLEQARVRQRGE